MSGHFETTEAKHAGVDWYAPLQNMGGSDDDVPAGQYAIGIDLSDGGAFYVGTLEELETFAGRVHDAFAQAQNHAERPLTLADFAPDEDGNYQCPRCDDTQTYEPLAYGDLAGLVSDIQQHIRDQHTVKP